MGDGGISSQARETAYSIDPYSVTSITDALETFLSDAALRAEYGDRSYSIAPEFDWNEVGRKRAKALNEACAGTTIRSLR
jgi:glycosyltransferase involved in cell wall biosynthesis